jgi:hypothetical protein
MKKIIMSLVVIAVVASLAAVGASGAFLSDDESTGTNVMTAGTLDLKVDVNSDWYRIVPPDTEPVTMGTIDIAETDLDGELFFNWDDVKPGDWGEATISVHVNGNDAWLKMVVTLAGNEENLCNEPEADADTTCDANVPWSGELAQNIKWTMWLDQGQTPGFGADQQDSEEGDNIWQPATEPILNDVNGDTLCDLLACPAPGDGPEMPNVKLSLVPDDPAGTPGPGYLKLVNCEVAYIGLAWEIDESVGNEIQSDQLQFILQFVAEQVANNPTPFE